MLLYQMTRVWDVHWQPVHLPATVITRAVTHAHTQVHTLAPPLDTISDPFLSSGTLDYWFLPSLTQTGWRTSHLLLWVSDNRTRGLCVCACVCVHLCATVCACVALSSNIRSNLWFITSPAHPITIHTWSSEHRFFLSFSLSSTALTTYWVLQRPVWGVWVLWMPSEPWHRSLLPSLQ